jgi:hypothetical protein
MGQFDCDADRSCNGICTFAFCTLEDFLCSVHPLCVGPGNGVSAADQAPTDTIVVSAGRRHVLRRNRSFGGAEGCAALSAAAARQPRVLDLSPSS